jgi:outer membrane protein
MTKITNFIQNLMCILVIILTSSTSLAIAKEEDSEPYSQSDSAYRDNDYDSLYLNEGKLLFKARIQGIKSTGKQSSFSEVPIVAGQSPIGNFDKNGYGAETSTTIFFSSNFATELMLGFDVLRTKYSSLASVAANYAGKPPSGKGKQIYMIPLTMTIQYHIAPFGGIRPYIGAGYHGAYLFTNNKNFKIQSGYGPVIQAGADFFTKDDTFINLDIRQHFLKSKVNYKTPIIPNRSLSSKAKINPLFISVGIGFCM